MTYILSIIARTLNTSVGMLIEYWFIRSSIDVLGLKIIRSLLRSCSKELTNLLSNDVVATKPDNDLIQQKFASASYLGQHVLDFDVICQVVSTIYLVLVAFSRPK